MPLQPGDKLGRYEILAPLGAGGMGEVYRARDSRLGRDVAIKVSSAQFTERFEREARAVAALNHPNICALYDVGPNYLVMELVEGETLRGHFDLDRAMPLIRQLIDGIEAAHEKNIVHRDLKPANIKITPEGVAKILDFGLAKAADHPETAGDPETSSTVSMTEAGTIVGTPAYMSPEQACGKNADKRSDIWSFGVVLYELLSGKRTFARGSAVETLAAVINEEPDWSLIPPRAQQLLKWCLEKDRKHRLQAIGDARRILVEEEPAAETHRPSLWIALSAALLAALLGLGFLHFREPYPKPLQSLRFQILPPESGPFGLFLSLSPDGRRLAFDATGADGQSRLWIRDLDSLQARPLAGTEGGGSPTWSPDSRFLAFGAGGKLKKIDVSGGPAQDVCEVQGRVGSGSWNVGGDLLFGSIGNGPGVWHCRSESGPASLILKIDSARQERALTFVSFLPDGRHFIYSRLSNNTEASGVYLGSLDDRPEEQPRRLISTQFSAVYAPSPEAQEKGHILFLRSGTLMAQAFDAQRLELTGEPMPVAERIGVGGTRGYFTTSANGLLAYRTSTGDELLTWFDRSGKAVGTVGTPAFMSGLYNRVALAPDDSAAAEDRYDPQTGFSDVWMHDLRRGAESRFTFYSMNYDPVWSPDGSEVAFSTTRDGGYSVYRKPASGSGQDEVLENGGAIRNLSDWSRDGRYLIETVRDPKTKSDIFVLPLTGDRKPFAYLQTEFNEEFGRLSPDNRWLAYTSDETKRQEVYVQAFPQPGNKLQISTDGGTYPVWRRDGQELYFISADKKLMAAKVKSGSKFEAGVPVPLFDVRVGVNGGRFEVSKDGRFLIPTPVPPTVASPVTVVLNWHTALKK